MSPRRILLWIIPLSALVAGRAFSQGGAITFDDLGTRLQIVKGVLAILYGKVVAEAAKESQVRSRWKVQSRR